MSKRGYSLRNDASPTDTIAINRILRPEAPNRRRSPGANFSGTRPGGELGNPKAKIAGEWKMRSSRLRFWGNRKAAGRHNRVRHPQQRFVRCQELKMFTSSSLPSPHKPARSRRLRHCILLPASSRSPASSRHKRAGRAFSRDTRYRVFFDKGDEVGGSVPGLVLTWLKCGIVGEEISLH